MKPECRCERAICIWPRVCPSEEKLVELFLARYGERGDGARVTIAPDAASALQTYPWPGNVRQLENAIHRGVVLCHDNVIRVEDIVLDVGDPASTRSTDLDLRAVLASVERDLISRAIR